MSVPVSKETKKETKLIEIDMFPYGVVFRFKPGAKSAPVKKYIARLLRRYRHPYNYIELYDKDGKVLKDENIIDNHTTLNIVYDTKTYNDPYIVRDTTWIRNSGTDYWENYNGIEYSYVSRFKELRKFLDNMHGK